MGVLKFAEIRSLKFALKLPLKFDGCPEIPSLKFPLKFFRNSMGVLKFP